ncbi:MAG: hypothetical protein AAFV29_27515, partial [Myxococcota bacterium]
FAVVIACTAAGAYATTQVDTRMDQSAFFSFDSPPARADRFARRHFGGAVFIQVHATADFSSPGVLRAWTRLADEVSTLSHVSSVQHIGQVVAQLNAALAGARRIPDTDAQVKLLYRFLAGDAAVEQLVTGDRKQSIMHIKVSTADLDELDQTLAAIERLTADSLPRRLRTVTVEAAPARAWLSSFLLGRIDAITRGVDVPQGAAQLERLRAELAKAPPPSQAADVRADLSSFLASPEAMVDLSSDQAQRDAIVAALMQPTEESQRGALARWVDDPEAIDDLMYAAQSERPAAEARSRARRWFEALTQAGLTLPGGAAGDRVRARILDELSVVMAPQAAVA